MTHAFDQGIAKRRRSRAKLPARQALIWFALILGTLGALASTAPLVVAASGLALITIIGLLWGSKAPPILLMPPLYQWSEVSLPPISTIWLRVPLDYLSIRGADLDTAAFYGLAGVVMLSLGLRLAIDFRRPKALLGNLQFEAKSLSFRYIARAAFTLIAIGYFFELVIPFAGPAREFFNAASGLKSAGLFILAYWCLSTGRNLGVLVVVFSFEILIGMTGFFAAFKDSILVLLVAALVARPKLGARALMPAAAVSMLLIAVGIFWSAVKMDYRAYVNQGTGAQVVLVSLPDRMNFISNEFYNFGVDDAQLGFERLIARHGYIDFLAQTLEFVPYGRPHENGALTEAVALHIITPRLIFSDKPPLPSDTEVMAKYTGQAMLWNENTSISLGHLAELYIDFGYLGGLIGMMVIGLTVGGIFRILAGHNGSADMLKAGLCVMISLPLAYFGTAYVKLVGAFVFTSILALGFQFFVLRLLPTLTALGKKGGGRRLRQTSYFARRR